MASECEGGRGKGEKKMTRSYFYLKKKKDSRPYVCLGKYRNNTHVYPQTSLGATVRKDLDGPQPQLMKLSIYAYSLYKIRMHLK